jgi:ribonuclease D
MSLTKEKPIFSYRCPRFEQSVLLAETPAALEELARRLRDSGETVFGFDTEMIDTRIARPQVRRQPGGPPVHSPTVVVQLATTREVAIFHLYEHKQLPQTLQQILRSDKYTKVGVATHNDADGLARTFGLSGMSHLLDLQPYGRLTGLPFGSLKQVAAWCGTGAGDKSRAHDWTTSLQEGSVRHEEIEYAALDAIVCLAAARQLAGHLPGQARAQPEAAL